MHSKGCPHDCLECKPNDNRGLTRETAIKIVCPVCNGLSTIIGYSIWCDACRQYSEYEFQNNHWYLFVSNTTAYTIQYRNDSWSKLEYAE